MKQTALFLLMSLSWNVHAQDPCEPLDPYDPVYQEVIEQADLRNGRSLEGVAYCGKNKLLWRNKRNDFDWGEDWVKTILMICDGIFKEDVPQVFDCHRSIVVRSESFEDEISLAADIDIERIEELVSAAKTLTAARDRVTRIDYVPVEDGGMWSEAQFGYQIKTSDYPNHQSGKVLHLKLACKTSRCEWNSVSQNVWGR